MKLPVTGGAGYIGGVVAAQLVAAGHTVTVVTDPMAFARIDKEKHVHRTAPPAQRPDW